MSTKLTWYGHACFLIDTGDAKVLTDPFLTGNPLAPVGPGDVSADFILVSHGHGDHLGDTLEIAPPQHITEEDPYFAQLSKRWGEGLRGLFASLPDPDWYPGGHQSGPDPRAS